MNAAFDERVILITGAASGIGEQLTLALAGSGANVLALDQDDKALVKLCNTIEKRGGRCLGVPFDLLQFDQYDQLFLAIKDQIPHLDGLVHCAGSLNRCTPMQYVQRDDFRKMLDIHLAAPNLLTQMLLPLIRRAKAASVIFTACDMTTEDQCNWHGYGLAKRALPYAAAMWQAEHPGKPYRFNCLNPGKVRTPLFDRAFKGLLPTTIKPAADVVPAYLALLAEESAHLRGQLLQYQDLLPDHEAVK